MAIDAVLFDLDYTLFDSEASEREALNMTLLDNGVSPTVEAITLYKAINKSLWEMLEREAIDLEYLRVNRFEQLLDSTKFSLSKLKHLMRAKTLKFLQMVIRQI